MKAGWEMKRLGDVCHIIGGGTPAKNKKEYYSGDIPWATVRDMKSEVVTNTEFKITKEAVKKSSTNIISVGNVIIATRVGLGKVCLLGQDTAINQDLRGIVPIDPESISVQFLFLWLTSVAKLIVAEGTGATVKGVKLPFVKSLLIPVPPLCEQRRIVAILDEAFAAIAMATANAEKSLAHAQELFESELNRVFAQRGDGWKSDVLKKLTHKIGSGATPRGGEKIYQREGTALIRSLNVYDREFRDSKLAFIDKVEADKLKNVTVEINDVLLNITGASIARCCTASGVPFPARVNQHVMIVRPDVTKLDTPFLCFLLTSQRYKNKLLHTGNDGGSTRQAITKQQMQSFRISFPEKLDEQKMIVVQLDSLAEKTRRLESIYQQKIQLLVKLKQSLLHIAFSGELTADPREAEETLTETSQ